MLVIDSNPCTLWIPIGRRDLYNERGFSYLWLQSALCHRLYVFKIRPISLKLLTSAKAFKIRLSFLPSLIDGEYEYYLTTYDSTLEAEDLVQKTENEDFFYFDGIMGDIFKLKNTIFVISSGVLKVEVNE